MDIEKKLAGTSKSWVVTNMGDEVTATQRNSWIVTVVEDKAKVAGEDYEELSDGRKVDGKMVPKLENEIPAISEKSLASSTSAKVSPIWGANQVLYKTEPPPPPLTVASYYVMTYHHSEAANMDAADIGLLWEKVSVEQKIKCIEEHRTIQKDYVDKFEHFVWSLEIEELKAFRVFMKKRDGQDVGDSDSGSDENSFLSSLNEERAALQMLDF